MDNKKGKERKFIRDIDRMLADKEVEIDKTIDEDYGDNINFAKKMIEVRDEPSPTFQERLKKRLLVKLAEKEATEARQRSEMTSFWNWLRNLIPESPVWRTAAVTVTVAVLTLVVVWRLGLFSPGEEPIVTGPLGPTVSVETRAYTEKIATVPVETGSPILKTIYAVGERIEINFFFKNITDETLTFLFPPLIKIDNARVETVRTFATGPYTKGIAPGESVQYDLTWDQKDDTGKQVPTGDYQVIIPMVQLGEGKGVVSLVESTILMISANP
jgi:hypothetical protein